MKTFKIYGKIRIYVNAVTCCFILYIRLENRNKTINVLENIIICNKYVYMWRG